MIKGLLQPYVDLGPCDRGPLFSVGIKHYWKAFDDPQSDPFMLQRTLPRTFRTSALGEIGCAEYAVDDPRDLPHELRTEKWTRICEALDRWSDLSKLTQWRLVALLHALCFYQLLDALVPSCEITAALSDPSEAELTYLRASARYVLKLPNRVSDYKDANLETFVAIAKSPVVPPQTGFNASIKVLTHLAKNGATETDLVDWSDRAVLHLNRLQESGSEFDHLLCTSRFHRAAAFIPMRSGNKSDVVKVMDLAEEYAGALNPKDNAQEVLRLENLHPLLESRTKEALWLGDLDAALDRATQVTRLDPFEARGWLELGEVLVIRQDWKNALEAYYTAALIGPPASAIARHMAGVCLQKLGQSSAAAFMLKSAIDIDPGAMSSRNHVQNLPDHDVFQELKRWNLSSAVP